MYKKYTHIRSNAKRNPDKEKADCRKRIKELQDLMKRDKDYMSAAAFNACIRHYEFIIN